MRFQCPYRFKISKKNCNIVSNKITKKTGRITENRLKNGQFNQNARLNGHARFFKRATSVHWVYLRTQSESTISNHCTQNKVFFFFLAVSSNSWRQKHFRTVELQHDQKKSRKKLPCELRHNSFIAPEKCNFDPISDLRPYITMKKENNILNDLHN